MIHVRKQKLVILSLLLALMGVSQVNAQESFVIDVVTEGSGVIPPVAELLVEDPFPLASLLDMHRAERYEREYLGEWDRANGYMFSVHTNTQLVLSKSYSAWQVPAYFFYRDWVFGLTMPMVEGRSFGYRGHDFNASGFGDLSMTLGYSFPLPVGMSYAAAMTLKFPTANSGAYRSRMNTPLGTGATDMILSVNLMHAMPFGDVQVLGQWRSNGDQKHVLRAVDPNDPTHVIDTEYDVHNANALLLKVVYNHRYWDLVDSYSGFHLKHLFEAPYTEWNKVDSEWGAYSSSYPGMPSLTTLEWLLGANYYYGPFTGRAQLVIPISANYGDRSAENFRDVEFRFGVTWFWAREMSRSQQRDHQLRERMKERQYRERYNR